MIKRILLTALLFASGTAHAQLYSKFGPVTGVMKGNVASPQTSAAASTDIIGLWSGCSGSNFLRGDGTCAVPAGTGVTSVGLTTPSWYTVTGSPVTGSGTLTITAATGQTANLFLATPNGSTGAIAERAIVGADVPPINLGSTANGGVSSATILLGTNGGTSNGFFSVTGPTTALRTFTFPNASATVLTDAAAVTVAQGGTGLQTLTAHGILLGEGTSNVSPLVMGADTVLRGTASADPVATAVNNCGSANTALSYSTSTHTFGCQTISTGLTLANPTGVVGLTAVNGSAATGMRSDGAPALDVSISPTWTGAHVFNQAPNFVAGFSGAASTNGQQTGSVSNSNTGVSTDVRLAAIASAGATTVMGLTGTNNITPEFTGGPVSQHGYFGTLTALPLSIGTNTIERMRISSTGAVVVDAPTSGIGLTVTGNTVGLAATSGASSAALTATPVTSGFQAAIFNGAASAKARVDWVDNQVSGRTWALIAGQTAGGTFDIFDGTGSTVRMSVTSTNVTANGAVLLPNLAASSAAQTGTVCWTTGGNLTVDTTQTCLISSIRYKQAILKLDSGLDAVMRLRPVSYELKPEYDFGHIGRQVGFIAEEVQKIDPRLTPLDKEGKPRSVEYAQMSAIVVNAIQQQQREIRGLVATVVFLGLWCGYLTFRLKRS